MKVMFKKLSTVFIVFALVFSSMGIAPDVSACPMKRGGDMQTMDCAHCPDCMSHDKNDGNKNKCCDDGSARCGMSSFSVFYAPTTVQVGTFGGTNITFILDNEQAMSVLLMPDKQPPRILS